MAGVRQIIQREIGSCGSLSRSKYELSHRTDKPDLTTKDTKITKKASGRRLKGLGPTREGAGMTQLIGRLVLLLVLTVSSPLIAEDDDNKKTTGHDATDGKMVELQKMSKPLETCTALVSTTIRIGDQEVTVDANGTFQKSSRMRIEESLPGGGGSVTLSDGSYLWMHDRSENMVTRINLARVYQVTEMEADVHQFDPLRPFRGVKWSTIRHTGLDTIEGVVHEAFEAEPLPSILFAQLPSPPTKVLLSVHPGDGLLRRASLFDAGGSEIVVQRFTEVQGNRKLDKKTFEFIVPAGAHPMDATEEMIGLFSDLK